MEISASTDTVTIVGNIKTVNDFQEIKSTIDLLITQYQTLTIVIQDSLSITSSVIGYFNKIILKDKINVNMKIGNTQLIELINDLNLSSIFKAKRL